MAYFWSSYCATVWDRDNHWRPCMEGQEAYLCLSRTTDTHQTSNVTRHLEIQTSRWNSVDAENANPIAFWNYNLGLAWFPFVLPRNRALASLVSTIVYKVRIWGSWPAWASSWSTVQRWSWTSWLIPCRAQHKRAWLFGYSRQLLFFHQRIRILDNYGRHLDKPNLSVIKKLQLQLNCFSSEIGSTFFS